MTRAGSGEAGGARRAAVLAELARHVLAVARPHPVRVGIDGCSAAGKTTLADELAVVLRRRSTRAVIRVELDYFKRAVALRTAYPPDSPDSYYLDSWDRAAMRDALLVPLGPGGSRRYRTAVMDQAGRVPIERPVEVASDDAILLADGAFLQRPELDDLWDLRIWVDVGFDEVLRRGIARDQAWMDSAAAAEARYRTKYIPGEARYVEEVRPAERAQIVVDNRDPAAPDLRVARG
jgi:uridine kinase